ncbi:MAG: hypothetical protein ABEH56_07620 [Salinirussus sp.]
MNLLVELIDSIVRMPGEFAAVASHDPLSALLMLVGTALVALPTAYLGYLVAGAAVDFVTADAAEPRRPVR